MTGPDILAALVTLAPVSVERADRRSLKTKWSIVSANGRELLTTRSDRPSDRELAEAVAAAINATVRALA